MLEHEKEGLRQPNKIRVIYDLSGSSINATVQTNESPKSHATDVVAGLSFELLRSGQKDFLEGRIAQSQQLAIESASI